MKRITKPEKWKDTFFYNLKPYEKLVFIFLYENCNDAGFIDLNFDSISSLIGITQKEVAACLKALEKTFIVSDDSSKIWIRKFLLHQDKLPLKIKTPDGASIKLELERNFASFNAPQEFLEITKFVSKKKGVNAESTFVKPTVDEAINYFANEPKWRHVPKDTIEQIYDHYQGCGWTVGKNKKPMEDWVASFRYCFRNGGYGKSANNTNGKTQNTSQQSLFNTQQPTKLDKITKANQNLMEFDFGTLARR